MDGAAYKVKKLAKRILPEDPHVLTLDPSVKYPATTNFWQHKALQFTTFISEADRGVLLTRPHYDMIEEPPNQAMSSSSTRPGSAASERKKKISLADYQTSKLKKASQSPPDSGPTSDLKPLPPPTRDSRDLASQDRDRKDTSSKTAKPYPDGRAVSSLNGDRRGDLVAKLSAKPSASPLVDGRKRTLEPEDSSRPQKRIKSDSISKPESSRLPQTDSPLRREDKAAHSDKISSRDIKVAEKSASVNGRVRSDSDKATASPRPAMNGVKAHPSSAAENRQTTPKKSEGGSVKASLPPLLSPLRLELGADQETDGKKKRPAEGGSSHLKPPPSKVQKTQATTAKKQKSPLRILPLLSPTLPPIVEQELARIKKDPSVSESGQSSSQGSDHPSAKKARIAEDVDDDKPSRAPSKPSLVVTLKYRKRDAKTVQRLLALKPRPQPDKKPAREMSASVEESRPEARKQPAASDVTHDSIAIKRPRLPAEKTVAVSRPAAPSTPLKAPAMSRAASSNSLARTPGDATSTPGDRPNTSVGDRERDRERDSAVAVHRGRGDRFQALGRKLKHERDALLRGGQRPANGAVRPDAARAHSSSDRDNRKLVAVLSLEMLMTYIIAWANMDKAREIERKALDPGLWDNLVAHVMELRGHAKGFRPLEIMLLQLQAQIYEQLSKALLMHEQTGKWAQRLTHANKERNKAWMDAHRALQQAGDDSTSMTTTIGPWTTPEATVRAFLPILRQWCRKNQVSWEEQHELGTAVS